MRWTYVERNPPKAVMIADKGKNKIMKNIRRQSSQEYLLFVSVLHLKTPKNKKILECITVIYYNTFSLRDLWINNMTCRGISILEGSEATISSYA